MFFLMMIWIDECEEMTEDKLRELSESVELVRLLFTKVIKLSNQQINFFGLLLTAVKGRIHNQQLNNSSPPILVFHPPQPRNFQSNDAPGYHNPVVFNLHVCS